MIAASRLEAWLHSGKLWRAAQELLAHVCANAAASGPSAARDHEVLAQLARMRLKTKPLQAAYQACLRDMVADSPALLRSVVTHTIYNELSNVRSPNNMAVLAALIHAQPHLVPAAMADTYQELVVRTEDFLRPLRALTRECVRATRSDAAALLPLARALAHPPPQDPPPEIRERAFQALADLFCVCCLVTAAHSKHSADYRSQLCALQQQALGWLLDTAVPVYRPPHHDFLLALNKVPRHRISLGHHLQPDESLQIVDYVPLHIVREDGFKAYSLIFVLDNVRGECGDIQQGGQLATGERACGHLPPVLRGTTAAKHAAETSLHRTLQGKCKIHNIQ